MNKYKSMLNEFIKVKSAFEKYENSCIEVDLSLMREQLPKLDVIHLHILVERYYPDLILSSMMSHGGVDCMKLTAPRDEIVECLELLILHYQDKNNEHMRKIIAEFAAGVRESDKTMFSLSKMLKQRSYNQ